MHKILVHQFDDGSPVQDTSQRVVSSPMFKLCRQILKPGIQLIHLQFRAIAAAHQSACFSQQPFVCKKQVTQSLSALRWRCAGAAGMCRSRSQQRLVLCFKQIWRR
jgi:hypothetical protein